MCHRLEKSGNLDRSHLSSTILGFWFLPFFCLLMDVGVGVHVHAADSDSSSGNGGRIVRDIEYARIEDRALKLDLYLPAQKARSPLIVWVHGGAWRSGSKSSMPLGKLVEDRYAIASVDYRLSTEAKFPAQIHDLKAAIRFLRGHGRDLGLPMATAR